MKHYNIDMTNDLKKYEQSIKRKDEVFISLGALEAAIDYDR